MKLKFDSKNPYRNLIKNIRKLILSKTEDVEKEFLLLETYAQTQCTTNHLYKHPSIKFFNIDVNSVPDEEDHSDFTKNPWEQVRTEFLHAMTCNHDEQTKLLSKSLMWFYIIPRTEDWVY